MASDVCYMQLLNCHQIASKKPTFQRQLIDVPMLAV